MNKLIVAMVALLSTAVYADTCYRNLSNNYQDSHTHRMNVTNTTSSDRLITMSYVGIKLLYRKHTCGSARHIRLKCGQAIKGNSNTEICYGEGDRGYFLVSKDYLDNINIIFNRWD